MFQKANTGKAAAKFGKPQKYCYPKRLAMQTYPEKINVDSIYVEFTEFFFQCENLLRLRGINMVRLDVAYMFIFQITTKVHD